MFNGEENREYDDEAAAREEHEKEISARCTDPGNPVERAVVAVEMELGRDLAAHERERIAAIVAEAPEFADPSGTADLVAELADAEVA